MEQELLREAEKRLYESIEELNQFWKDLKEYMVKVLKQLNGTPATSKIFEDIGTHYFFIYDHAEYNRELSDIIDLFKEDPSLAVLRYKEFCYP